MIAKIGPNFDKLKYPYYLKKFGQYIFIEKNKLYGNTIILYVDPQL